MQAGRQAGGLAGRQPLPFEMLRCIVLDGPQSKLVNGENDVIVSECVWWRVPVLVYLREGLQALLQNTPDMPLRRQPMMFAMLQCIVLDGAAEHATLLVSLAHQHKCEAVEPKSLAHGSTIWSCITHIRDTCRQFSVMCSDPDVLGCQVQPGYPSPSI